MGALPVLLGAQPAAPPPASRPHQPGAITIAASGLRIEPGRKANFLRFQNGVHITGAGFSLRADVVEVDVLSTALGMESMKLPKLEAPPERVIADPGATVRDMASEIRGPSARLEPSAIGRLAASGHVRVEGQGLALETQTVYSADGGQTWSTASRASLAVRDPRRGLTGRFSARQMSFNVQAQTLLARGGLEGRLQQQGEAPYTLTAESLHADLERSLVEVSGDLQLAQGEVVLSAAGLGRGKPPLTLDLARQTVDLASSFRLADMDQGLTLTGNGLAGSFAGHGELKANGSIRLADPRRKLLLTASAVQAQLRPLRVTASGRVHLGYGASSYDAGEAVITRQGDKYVVEIQGPQTGQIDLGALSR
jgi:hypothetical protein